MSAITKAYLATITQVFIIGFSFVAIKTVLRYTSPTDVLALRFMFATFTLMIPIVLNKVHITLHAKDYLILLPLGVFYPILFFGFQVLGLSYATTTEAGILSSTVPIFTIILAAIILKERTTGLQKWMIFLSVSAMIYMTYMDSQHGVTFHIKGTIFLLLSVIASAFYIVLIRQFAKSYAFQDLTFFTIFFGFIFFSLLSVFSHIQHDDYLNIFNLLKHPDFFFSILYLGILSTYITSLLNNYSLSILDAAKVSVFTNIIPIITLLSGVIILDEHIYHYHIIGITLTMIGVIGANMSERSTNRP